MRHLAFPVPCIPTLAALALGLACSSHPLDLPAQDGGGHASGGRTSDAGATGGSGGASSVGSGGRVNSGAGGVWIVGDGGARGTWTTGDGGSGSWPGPPDSGSGGATENCIDEPELLASTGGWFGNRGSGGSGSGGAPPRCGTGGSGSGGAAVIPPCDPANGCDPEVATSQAKPPYGIWTMIVQYGPVGVPVSPTIALQLELRPDESAYRWLCAGAPADGSLTAACSMSVRFECLTGTIRWDGVRWRVDYPEARVGGVPQQGSITPDGRGNILISYINPTYSGALFHRVGDAAAGAAACIP